MKSYITEHFLIRYVERIENIYKESEIELFISKNRNSIMNSISDMINNSERIYTCELDNKHKKEYSYYLYGNILLIAEKNEKQWITMYKICKEKKDLLKIIENNNIKIETLNNKKKEGDIKARKIGNALEHLKKNNKDEKEILKNELELSEQIRANLVLYFKIKCLKMENKGILKHITNSWNR